MADANKDADAGVGAVGEGSGTSVGILAHV